MTATRNEYILIIVNLRYDLYNCVSCHVFYFPRDFASSYLIGSNLSMFQFRTLCSAEGRKEGNLPSLVMLCVREAAGAA